jgi:hypothetical protein
MKRGNRLSLPHVLPDMQMEHMAQRGAETLRAVVPADTVAGECARYRLAYDVLTAAGFVAACNANRQAIARTLAADMAAGRK